MDIKKSIARKFREGLEILLLTGIGSGYVSSCCPSQETLTRLESKNFSLEKPTRSKSNDFDRNGFIDNLEYEIKAGEVSYLTKGVVTFQGKNHTIVKRVTDVYVDNTNKELTVSWRLYNDPDAKIYTVIINK